MAVSGIQKKTMTISIPVAAYCGLQELASREGKTPTQYVRGLIVKQLGEQGVALYDITAVKK